MTTGLDPIFTENFKPTPYWWEAAPRADPPSTPVQNTDVAIVGSGYTGLSAALTLVRRGREVTILEAEQPGYGASSRNAGFVGKTLKHSFSGLIATRGLSYAIEIYREVQAAFDYVSTLIRDEEIDCHFQQCGRFMAALSPGQYEQMAKELDLKSKHLGDDSEMVPRSEQHREIGSDQYHGGAVVPKLCSLHPGLYHQGLLRRAAAEGALIMGNTRVTTVTQDKDHFIVHTDRGQMHARNVIVATNGYTTSAITHLSRRVIPFRAYMLATETLDEDHLARILPTHRTVHDFNNNIIYLRRAPDNSRLLAGGLTGCGEPDAKRVAARLHHKLCGVFEAMRDVRIEHAWSGLGAATFDLYPHLGCRDGIHYAMGYCFAGVPMGTYLGHKIALKVLGDQRGDTILETLPFPTRFYYWGKPWFVPLVMRWYDWIDNRSARN